MFSLLLKNRCILGFIQYFKAKVTNDKYHNQTFKRVLAKVAIHWFVNTTLFTFVFFFFAFSPICIWKHTALILSKVNAWSVEMRAPWESNGGGRGSEYCKKIPSVPIITLRDLQPEGETGQRDQGIWCLFPLLTSDQAMPDPSASNSFHSVLSSRCQEVAQCFSFFFFF